MDDVMTTAPVLDVKPADLAAVRGEVERSHQSDRPWCQRREPREQAGWSRRGWVRRLARQAVEPMVWPWVGGDRPAGRSLHGCSSLGAWDDEGILKPPGREVARDRGADDGVWMTDGRDVPQQGQASGGVKRPDGGPWGTRANGPAGVLGG